MRSIPASRAAIFTTSGLVLTDFTADREKLHNAVNKIQPYTSGIDPQQVVRASAITWPICW